jgi:hypothetical protein
MHRRTVLNAMAFLSAHARNPGRAPYVTAIRDVSACRREIADEDSKARPTMMIGNAPAAVRLRAAGRLSFLAALCLTLLSPVAGQACRSASLPDAAVTACLGLPWCALPALAPPAPPLPPQPPGQPPQPPQPPLPPQPPQPPQPRPPQPPISETEEQRKRRLLEPPAPEPGGSGKDEGRKKSAGKEPSPAERPVLAKADGYRGIWYYNEPQKDEYVYKYSGGLGTYCSSHNPFAVYSKEANKTFFCYGGTGTDTKGNRALLHMVSFYDHATGTVPRPTILLDKRTADAHDNPVISLDDKGRIWIFSSSHGTGRPSYIFASKKPYDIDDFERVWTGNFSYPQPYWLPGRGFLLLHTSYRKEAEFPDAIRKLYFSTSPDGRTWSRPTLCAAIEMGHYQVSWSDGKKVGTAFNFHPSPVGLNARTNLYYTETSDLGTTWRNAAGEAISLPLSSPQNPALVHDYKSEGLKVYLMDVNFDAECRPVILYLTSRGHESGPANDPRTWCTAWWSGSGWEIHGSIRSDNNYDMGSIWVEDGGEWRIIGPTEPGPQRYNTGGEIAMWTSTDRGNAWTKVKQLTAGSRYNHGYCRRPVDAHPDFYAIWADGHARQPSESRLHFCDREGNVRLLPPKMAGDAARPEPAP